MHHPIVVLTRPAEQSQQLAESIGQLGAAVLICPAIGYAPTDDLAALDQALTSWQQYDWVCLTSATALRFVEERVHGLGLNLHQHTPRIAAVGQATAAALVRAGLPVDCCPEQASAAGLLASIPVLAGQRILIPTSDLADQRLAAGLRTNGALVDQVIAYRTIAGPGGQQLAAHLGDQSVDLTCFSSPSAITFLLHGLTRAGIPAEQAIARLGIAIAIGPTTANAAKRLGLPTRQATSASDQGMLLAIAAALEDLLAKPFSS
jgi:uroporphyrinogen-III synthase